MKKKPFFISGELDYLIPTYPFRLHTNGTPWDTVKQASRFKYNERSQVFRMTSVKISKKTLRKWEKEK